MIPIGWLVHGGYFYRDAKSAFWRASKEDAPPPEALFTSAQIDEAVAAERERCAEICDQEHERSDLTGDYRYGAVICASRIRLDLPPSAAAPAALGLIK